MQLLDQVVETLRRVSRASPATDKLYNICTALAKMAKVLVDSTESQVDGYDQEQDMLHFVDNMGQIAAQGNEYFPGADTGDEILFQDAENLSGILNDWVVGESP